MSDTEVIEIAEDGDDDVEIVHTTPSKVSQLRQQIELLQAFCKSPDPIPLEYHKFYCCAKKLNPNFNDVTILSAWKRALSKQLTSMVSKRKKNHFSARKQTCNNPPFVDLTECNINKSSTLALSHSSETPQLLDDQQTSEDVVPVALFANPIFQSKKTDLQTISHNVDNTGNITMVNNNTPEYNFERFYNINTNSNYLNIIEPGINVKHKMCVQSRKTVEEITINITDEKTSTESTGPLQTKLSVLTSNENIESECTVNRNMGKSDLRLEDEECSSRYENNPMENVECSFINNSDDSKQSNISNESIDKEKKEKYRDNEKCSALLDLSDNISSKISKSFLGVPAKITKPGSISKMRNLKKTRSMSEAEFKLFRKEQKKQKLLEKRKLVSKQLEIVHDRLVDVLIPKYYDKTS